MAEYSELETLKANGCDGGNTIRTHFAEIIVRGTADKPYYEILYFDTEDGSYHIGFGSYYLEYVFKWLSEEFETVADWQTADIAPVRHGRWLLQANNERTNYRWNVTAECSECCDEEKEIWAGFFPNVPDWLARDVALESAKSVKLSNYCPNCGARMDGDGNDR